MKRKFFDDVSMLWLADRENYVKETSLAAYSLIIRNHLAPEFVWLDQITPDSAQALAEKKLDAGKSVTTVKGIILVLKMIIRFSEKHGWIAERRYDIKFPKTRKAPNQQVLAVEDEKRFFQCLYDRQSPRDLGLMICICCGLRIGEVCALKWKDVDLKNRLLHVRRTVYRIYLSDRRPYKSMLTIGPPKTLDSQREVPLIEVLAECLAREKRSMGPSPESFVLSGGNKPVDPQTFRNHFKSVTDELGIPPRKVHSLRHTFATRCVESKCDFKTLSTLLGHSDISTTLNLYVHPGLEQKRRCLDEMMKMI